MADVKLNIKSDVTDAERDLKKLDSAGSKLSGTFKAIGAAVVAGFAFNKIAQGISSVVTAAAKQQDAVNSMNQALKSAGDFSVAASEDLQKFASDLQSISTIGDETTLQMLSLAKTFGISNDRAKELVTAAAELSAATGMSLEGAVRNLGKTMSGLTGELGESLPAMRNLTAEQLKAGAAIDLVNKRFAGSAASKLNTYAGAVEQLTNTWGDFQETLGDLIVQNPVVIRSIRLLTEGISKAIDFVKRNQDSIIDGFLGFAEAAAEAAPYVVRAIQSMVTPVNTLKFTIGIAGVAWVTMAETAVGAFEVVTSRIKPLLDSFSELPELAKIALPAPLRAAMDLGAVLVQNTDEAKTKIGELKTGLMDFAGEAADELTVVSDHFTGLKDQIKELREAYKSGGLSGAADFVGPVKPADESKAKDSAAATGFAFAGGFKIPFIDAMAEAGKALASSFKDNVGKGAAGGQAVAVEAATQAAGLAGQGLSALGSSLGGVGGALLGGAGGIFSSMGPLLGELAGLSKEEAKKRAEEFAKGFAQALTALAENVPVFIEALAENSGEIITALVSNAPKIVIAIARGLINAIPIVMKEFADGLRFQVDNLGPKFTEVAAKFSSGVNDVINGIKEIPAALGTEVPKAISGAGQEFATAVKDVFLQPFIDTMTAGAMGFVDELVRLAGGVVDALNPFSSATEGSNPVKQTGNKVSFNPRDPLDQFQLTGGPVGGGTKTIQLVIDSRVLGQVILDLNSSGARLTR